MKTLGRKVQFGIIAMVLTLFALVFCLRFPESGAVLFPAYATFAAAVVTAVVVGNVGEHMAQRGQK